MAAGRRRHSAPDTGRGHGGPSSPLARRFPIVVEKILSRGETLPADWPIDGTVGYEFLNALNGLFVDSQRLGRDQRDLPRVHRRREPFAELLHESKLLVEDRLLASELTALTRQLSRVAELDRRSRDFTIERPPPGAPRGRSPASGSTGRTSGRASRSLPHDRDAIEQAVARARHRRPSVDDLVYDFVRDVLTLRLPERLLPEERAAGETVRDPVPAGDGPVQAKGLEDTAFYRQSPWSRSTRSGATRPGSACRPGSSTR